MSRQSSQPRKYEQKKRAEDVANTRRRITEAAIDLHGSLGPSRTTLSAVAQRAGVERRTLYRHFPTEADLFAACSAHYFTANPFPELDERLEPALAELYAYYERNEPMFTNVLRDAALVDFAREAISPLDAFLDDAVRTLLAGRGLRGKRRRMGEGMLRHVLAFSTWRSLWANGIASADAARAMSGLVESV